MRKPIARSSACASGNASQLSLLDWTLMVLAASGQTPARHHLKLLEYLEGVSQGSVDRLMVLMPPGSAKSTFVSVLFPAWWFVGHPRSSLIAASHTADLAAHFGRQVRGLITEYSDALGYRLAPESRAASRWRTSGGGSISRRACADRSPGVGLISRSSTTQSNHFLKQIV
jgi:hypothetical protein